MADNKQHIEGREFVSLITANQRRIYAYIFTLVPNLNDADDIMQETTALMWEQKDDFTPGTDFVAWGARIAYFKVLDYRKRANKNRRMISNAGQFKKIEETALKRSQHLDTMINNLEECVKKLRNPDRQLIYLRYSLELSVKEISTRLNKSIRSLYLGISRVQGFLLECVERHNA